MMRAYTIPSLLVEEMQVQIEDRNITTVESVLTERRLFRFKSDHLNNQLRHFTRHCASVSDQGCQVY